MKTTNLPRALVIALGLGVATAALYACSSSDTPADNTQLPTPTGGSGGTAGTGGTSGSGGIAGTTGGASGSGGAAGDAGPTTDAEGGPALACDPNGPSGHYDNTTLAQWWVVTTDGGLPAL